MPETAAPAARCSAPLARRVRPRQLRRRLPAAGPTLATVLSRVAGPHSTTIVAPQGDRLPAHHSPLLAQGQPVEVRGDELILAFSPPANARNFQQSGIGEALLRDALGDHFGGKWKIARTR